MARISQAHALYAKVRVVVPFLPCALYEKGGASIGLRVVRYGAETLALDAMAKATVLVVVTVRARPMVIFLEAAMTVPLPVVPPPVVGKAPFRRDDVGLMVVRTMEGMMPISMFITPCHLTAKL